MDGNTPVDGSSTAGLYSPMGIDIFETDVVSVIIADEGNARIVRLWDDGTNNRNVSVLATERAPGQSLVDPYNVYVDVKNGPNLYVTDAGYNFNGQVILYSNI